MYTSYIGKKFLQYYKKRENKPDDYSAKSFFDEILFPLFFDDEGHLMHVGNSPFFQKPKDEDVKQYGDKARAQYSNLVREVENGSPSGAIYVGFAAKEIKATTTGQITNMQKQINSEEIYASWIGAALGIGVKGGQVMLIDKEEIMMYLFSGWKQYRSYLRQTPNLKDKQIETWNGNWLCHCLSREYDEADELFNFNLDIESTESKMAISTKKWTSLVFGLSRKFHRVNFLTAYVYTLSQTNTTFGFINIYLAEVRRPFELRDKIFLNKSDFILSDKEIESLESTYSFKNACKLGTIGLKSLEPEKLRDFMPAGSAAFAGGKEYRFTDQRSHINYSLFKIWIIAMLNKTELLQIAADVAKTLASQDSSNNRGKTTQSQRNKDLLESRNLRSFIEGLAENLDSENASIYKEVVNQIIRMPVDNFPLFLTLVRFEYSFLINSKNQSN